LLTAANASAEQHRDRINVSAQVLSGHRSTLDLPAMPRPGHVLQEDMRGVHYFYAGSLSAARAHYREEMAREGFRLRNESSVGESRHEMLWERSGETALVRLHAATGLAPTRISVRMMGQSSVATRRIRK
jgi:hypothetical protein